MKTMLVLDPTAPGFARDPYPQLAELRESAPVHWSDALASYVVLRFDDVSRLAFDRSLIGSIGGRPRGDATAPSSRSAKMMIRRDGDEHTRLRRLVSKAFTPRAIEQWRLKAEEITERLLARASDRDQIDVVSDFAVPLPTQIISEMLGVPRDDIAQLRAWSNGALDSLEQSITPEVRERADANRASMDAYFDELIVEKRRQPDGALLSALIAAEEAGDCLDDEEIRQQVVLLFGAGQETTVNLIGNAVVHLLARPDQLARLRADPFLDANVVEEMLRIESPAPFTERVTTQPIEIGGVPVEAGAHVTLSLASANRDERKWGPTAADLDIVRVDARDHVTFGGGPHYCLGAALARLEGQVAIPRLVRRFPAMHAIDDTPAWRDRVMVRGLTSLRVALR